MRPYVHPRSSTPPRIALRTAQEREGSRRDMGGLKSTYSTSSTSWCVHRDVGTLGLGVSRDTIACMVWDSAGGLGTLSR